MGLPSELTEPALAGAMDLALRRLCYSKLTDQDWERFHGRVEGVHYVATCLRSEDYRDPAGVHASIATSNELYRFKRLIERPDRNEIIRSIINTQH